MPNWAARPCLQAVKEIFAEQPGRPKPVIDHAPAEAVALAQPRQDVQTPPTNLAGATVPATAGNGASPSSTPDGTASNCGGLVPRGWSEIDRDDCCGKRCGEFKGRTSRRLDQVLSSLFTRDPRTSRAALTIPLPESVTQERCSNAISVLLNALRHPQAGRPIPTTGFDRHNRRSSRSWRNRSQVHAPNRKPESETLTMKLWWEAAGDRCFLYR